MLGQPAVQRQGSSLRRKPRFASISCGVAVFHMFAKTVPFKELGEAFLDQQARTRTTTNLVRRLNNLGYDVLLRPKVELKPKRSGKTV